MTVSAKISALAGIDAASVVMATATNVENLTRAGLGSFEVKPNDLVVVVAGHPAMIRVTNGNGAKNSPPTSSSPPISGCCVGSHVSDMAGELCLPWLPRSGSGLRLCAVDLGDAVARLDQPALQRAEWH